MWDYIDQRHTFLAWAEDVDAATPVANPPALLRWNTDKGYLRDLADAGVPTAQTAWIDPVDEIALPDWPEFIVKPAVSAGGRGAARYGDSENDRRRAEAHVQAIHGLGVTAMVQPYLSAIEDTWETGTFIFGGEPSHAIGKSPILHLGAPPPDDYTLAATQESVGRALDPDLVALAQRAVAAIPGCADRPPLYARVDTVPTSRGPVVLELEAVEPHFFLETSSEAPRNFATAVAALLRSQTTPKG